MEHRKFQAGESVFIAQTRPNYQRNETPFAEG